MSMQITDAFEKPTSKSCHCIKNHIIVAYLRVKFQQILSRIKESFHMH